MPYCTEAQLVTKFGADEIVQLTDYDGVGSVNTDVLAAAQAAADSDIDKRLRMRGWTVPLATVTPDIVAIALDMTRFYLYNTQEIDIVSNAYKRRIQELNDYVAGKLLLDIGYPDAVAGSAGDVDFAAPERVFNRSTLAGF